MAELGQVGQGVVWSLVRTWGSRLAGFVIYFQLAHLLAPSDMGLFAACFAVIALMELLVDQGLIDAVVQRKELSTGLLSAVFAANLAFAVLMLALLVCLAPSLERWMQAPELASVVMVAGCALISTAAGMCQEALARRALDFKLLAMRSLLSTLVSGAFGVWLAYAGHGVWALVGQFVLASLLNTAAMWIKPRWKPVCLMDVRGLRDLMKFGMNVLGLRLVNYAGTRGVDLLVGYLMGAALLGIFSVGAKLQYICLQLLGTALVDVAYPTWARLQAHPEQLRSAHLSAVRAVAVVSMPLWALIAALAPEAVAIAFGPKWVGAGTVLQAMCVVGAVQLLNQFDAAALSAAGKPSRSLFLGVLRAMSVLVAITVAGTTSLQAASWSMVVANFATLPLFLMFMYRFLGMSLRSWFAAVGPAVLGALVVVTVVFAGKQIMPLTPWSALPRAILFGSIGLSAYAVFMLTFARGQLHGLRAELRQLRGR